MRNGTVEFVELKSRVGGDCQLKNPWADDGVILYRNGQQAEPVTGNLLKFQTTAQEVVLILKKGTAPGQFKRTIARHA